MSNLKVNHIQCTDNAENSLILSVGPSTHTTPFNKNSPHIIVDSVNGVTLKGLLTIPGVTLNIENFLITSKLACGDSIFVHPDGYSNTPPVTVQSLVTGATTIPDQNSVSNTRNVSALAIKSLTSDSTMYFGNYGLTGSWIQEQKNNNSTGNLCLNPIGGNVGVGTLNPLTALHVNGEVRATTTTAGSDPNTLTTKNYVDSSTNFTVVKGIYAFSANQTSVTISPPAGYVMNNLIAFFPSLEINQDWTGLVDGGDSVRCEYVTGASNITLTVVGHQHYDAVQPQRVVTYGFWSKP